MIFVCVCMSAHVQSVMPDCNPMDFSLPGSSAHGIFQAGILEWVPSSYSRDFLNPGIEPASIVSPDLASGFFSAGATWEAPV